MPFSKKRILFLINNLKRGGSERIFVNQLNFLSNLNYDVYLALLYKFNKDNSYYKDLKINESNIINFDLRNKSSYKSIGGLKKFVKRHNINIVYSTLNTSNNFARILKFFVPSLVVIIREAGSADYFKGLKNKVFDIVLNLFVYKIIAVSNEVRESLEKYQKIHAKKIVVIENGVLLKDWHIIIHKRKQSHDKKLKEFTILNIGSMNDGNKGQKGILEIVKEIKEKKLINNIKLILVGDGLARKRYEQYMVDKDLQNNVIFPGRVSTEKINNFYLKSDLFILNSESEGCSNTVLEAMSFGLPVISTKVGGVTKIIEDKKSGYLVDRGDKDGMIRIIVSLAQSRELRSQIGFNAFQRIKEKYSMKRNINELINIFKSV